MFTQLFTSLVNLKDVLGAWYVQNFQFWFKIRTDIRLALANVQTSNLQLQCKQKSNTLEI